MLLRTDKELSEYATRTAIHLINNQLPLLLGRSLLQTEKDYIYKTTHELKRMNFYYGIFYEAEVVYQFRKEFQVTLTVEGEVSLPPPKD